MGLFARLFGDGRAVRNAYAQTEAYTGTRERLLGLTAADVGMPARPHLTIAALMETAYTEAAVATLATVADGSACIYFSGGGGIAGGEHESVRTTARAFLDLAACSRAELQPTESFPLPGANQIRFYLVTSDGVLTGEVAEESVGHMRHPLFPLFHSGHALIAAIRRRGPGRV